MANENSAGNATAAYGGWQGLASGVASGIIGGAFSLGASALNYKYNKQLADKQNQFNLDMWRMTNEYNSPAAQMQRYKDAGLNPLLIYGQGSSGNASSAPQMVTPDAPKFDKAAAELSKAFNIENLLTLHAKRKQAQEEARISELSRFDKEDQRQAQTDFGLLYDYDPVSGRFVFSPSSHISVADNPRGHRPGDRPTNTYWFKQSQIQGEKNWLTPVRQSLLEEQRNILVPQVRMQNYESKYYPYSFWIGNGSRVLNALPLPRLNFKFNK